MTKTLVDWTKPIELIDGTPATFLKKSGTSFDVRIDAPVTNDGHLYPAGAHPFKYNSDGSRRWGDSFPAVRNRVANIDWTLPVEDANGRLCRVTSMTAGDSKSPVVVEYADGTAGGNFFSINGFRDGTDNAHAPSGQLRNRITPKAPMLDLTKPLKTADGKAVTLIASNISGAKPLLFEIAYGTGFAARTALELRYADGRVSDKAGRTSGDDIVNKIVITEEFRNVYADASIGGTIHKSFEIASISPKTGKTRIGVLHITKHDGEAVASKYTAGQPYTHKRGVKVPAFVAA